MSSSSSSSSSSSCAQVSESFKEKQKTVFAFEEVKLKRRSEAKEDNEVKQSSTETENPASTQSFKGKESIFKVQRTLNKSQELKTFFTLKLIHSMIDFVFFFMEKIFKCSLSCTLSSIAAMAKNDLPKNIIHKITISLHGLEFSEISRFFKKLLLIT